MSAMKAADWPDSLLEHELCEEVVVADTRGFAGPGLLVATTTRDDDDSRSWARQPSRSQIMDIVHELGVIASANASRNSQHNTSLSGNPDQAAVTSNPGRTGSEMPPQVPSRTMPTVSMRRGSACSVASDLTSKAASIGEGEGSGFHAEVAVLAAMVWKYRR